MIDDQTLLVFVLGRDKGGVARWGENYVTTKYDDEKVSNCWLETEGVGGEG